MFSKKRLLSAFTGLLFATTLSSQALAQDYSHSITEGKMTFSWSIDGDNIAAKVSAPTTGWVSVGFNPTSRMKDADIIIGYVKGDKVTIKDEFGTAGTKHKSDTKIGGTDNVTVIGGSEENKVTTIEFSVPLNSGDAKDTVIDPDGDTPIILAYGPDKDSFRLKHPKAYQLTVNLRTGARK